MKLSECWLRTWVNPAINRQALVEQLTFSGLEVSQVSAVAPPLDNVLVGQIVRIDPHPQAAQLSVCLVAIATADPLTIVCGAANLAVGMKVVVACVGAVLPSLGAIQAVDKKGVRSAGMLCTQAELGLQQLPAAQDLSADMANNLVEKAIWALPPDAPVGTKLSDYLELDDVTIELELTPNRGDCLSVRGVAREVAAKNDLPMRPPAVAPIVGQYPCPIQVQVAAPEACPSYFGCVISGIASNATTPIWMQERLRRSGLRVHSLIVDVTNYVMLELGQPLHAFDLQKLRGSIGVRFAQPAEQLLLLNGNTIQLREQNLLIVDDSGPIALAGVMGGFNTEVDGTTSAVFLESAFFAPMSVSGTARSFGLNTDASMRFERGVDPELQALALARVSELLCNYGGGQVSEVVQSVHPEQLPKRPQITLRKTRLQQLIGMDIPPATVAKNLQALELIPNAIAEGWQVKIPSHRFDLNIEVDLIEEVARLYGFHHIPARVLNARNFSAASEKQLAIGLMRQILVNNGYTEAITYSFVSPRLNQLINPTVPGLSLQNPLSAELAQMRTSLWPGLLTTLQYNLNRQALRVRLFEVGRRYLPQDNHDLPSQDLMLAGLAYGTRLPIQWDEPAEVVDFFAVKHDIEQLIAATLQASQWQFKRGEHAALHPGQTAQIFFQNQPVGLMGVLHPALRQELDLNMAPILFEIKLAALQQAHIVQARDVSKFPSVWRDLAFLIDRKITVANILQCIQEAAGHWLSNVTLFDVYMGERIAADKKSVALRLTFACLDRTLQDEEINQAIVEVVTQMVQQFAAELRS